MANKFNVKQDGDVAFNSSLTYLMRLNFWLQQAHLLSDDDDDMLDSFRALEQASIEIDGVCDPEERDSMERIRVKVKKELLKATKDKNPLPILREIVRPYHLNINRMAHLKGILMMRNKAEGMDDLI